LLNLPRNLFIARKSNSLNTLNNLPRNKELGIDHGINQLSGRRFNTVSIFLQERMLYSIRPAVGHQLPLPFFPLTLFALRCYAVYQACIWCTYTAAQSSRDALPGSKSSRS